MGGVLINNVEKFCNILYNVKKYKMILLKCLDTEKFKTSKLGGAL